METVHYHGQRLLDELKPVTNPVVVVEGTDIQRKGAIGTRPGFLII